MSKIIVGIGELGVSSTPDDEVKTFALGSCVAIVILDPKTRVGGLAHIALPESSIDPERGVKQPAYFADTGLPALLNEMKKKGSVLHPGYIVKLIGGANVIADEDHFAIGKRNVTAIRKLLWDLKLPIAAEDVGKNFSRTVRVEMKTGAVYVTTSTGEEWRV